MTRQRQDCLKLGNRLGCHVAEEHLYEGRRSYGVQRQDPAPFRGHAGGERRGEFGVLLVVAPRPAPTGRSRIWIAEAELGQPNAGRSADPHRQRRRLGSVDPRGPDAGDHPGLGERCRSTEHKGERQRRANEQRREAGCAMEHRRSSAPSATPTGGPEPLQPEARALLTESRHRGSRRAGRCEVISHRMEQGTV